MNFPAFPIPEEDTSNAANLVRKMDTEAKEQGLSSWMELAAKRSPEMADIMTRIIEGELSAIKTAQAQKSPELS